MQKIGPKPAYKVVCRVEPSGFWGSQGSIGSDRIRRRTFRTNIVISTAAAGINDPMTTFPRWKQRYLIRYRQFHAGNGNIRSNIAVSGMEIPINDPMTAFPAWKWRYRIVCPRFHRGNGNIGSNILVSTVEIAVHEQIFPFPRWNFGYRIGYPNGKR